MFQCYSLSPCPVLVPEPQLLQIWRNENEHVQAQEALQQLRQVWEARKLRLLNFILHVPCKPSALGRSKKQMLHRDIMAQDSGTFILSGETQPCGPVKVPRWRSYSATTSTEPGQIWLL